MEPEKIKLNNFRSFDDFEYTYRPGITGLKAPNFAGKSNFCDLGQRFGWTGITPSGINKKDLLNWYSKQGYVEFSFSHQGENYTLTRNVHNSTEILASDSGKEIKDRDEIKSITEEMTGVSSDLISEYCFIRQFNLIDIILLPRSKRMDYILRLVGGDRAERIRKKLQDTVNKIPFYPDQTDRINELEKELKELKDTLEEKNSTLKEIEKDIPSDDRIKELRRTSEKYIDSDIKDKIEKLDEEIEELKNKINEKGGIGEDLKEIEPLSDEEENYLRYVYEVKPEIEKYEKKLENLKEPDKVYDPQTEYENLLKMKNDFDNKKEYLNLILEGLCPTCQRPFDEYEQKDIDRRRQELKEFKEDFDRRKEEYRKNKEAYDQYCEDYNKYRSEYNHIESTLESLRKKVPEKEFSVDSLEKRKKDYEEYKKQLREYQSRRKEIENLQEDKAGKEARRKDLQDTETVTEEQKNEAEREIENAESLKDRKTSLETEIKVSEERKTGLKRELESLYKDRDQAEINRQGSEFLKSARDIFHKDRLPSRVLLDRRYMLNQNIREYLENIESGFTAYLDEEFGFRINFTGGMQDRPVEDLSGGQKIMLGIVFHLAKLHLLPQVPFLVLDEPTMYLSKKLVGEVADMFTYFSNKCRREGINAYIMVSTHEPELDSCFDRVYNLETGS
mgnify:CR=1 FL=1